jgi:hypothetical protein
VSASISGCKIRPLWRPPPQHAPKNLPFMATCVGVLDWLAHSASPRMGSRAGSLGRCTMGCKTIAQKAFDGFWYCMCKRDPKGWTKGHKANQRPLFRSNGRNGGDLSFTRNDKGQARPIYPRGKEKKAAQTDTVQKPKRREREAAEEEEEDA